MCPQDSLKYPSLLAHIFRKFSWRTAVTSCALAQPEVSPAITLQRHPKDKTLRRVTSKDRLTIVWPSGHLPLRTSLTVFNSGSFYFPSVCVYPSGQLLPQRVWLPLLQPWHLGANARYLVARPSSPPHIHTPQVSMQSGLLFREYSRPTSSFGEWRSGGALWLKL